MKKKTLFKVLILFALTLVSALIIGCSRYVVIEGITMKDTETIEITLGDFSYEDKKIIVHLKGGEEREIALTEDMIPVAERLKFYKIGEQEVKVVYNNRYATTFKINVVRKEFEDVYQLNGYVCTYDGKPHRVELNRELPEGARIDYKYGNTFTNAGTYNVVGVISKDGYVSKTLSTQLVIEKATYDLSEMVFENATAVYDGTIKTIEATNIPEGVNVTYEVYDGDIRINNALNAGEYRVVAKFEVTDNNFNSIPRKSATLTINKADYDMSRVHLNDYTKFYDGAEYTPAISSDSVLPHGVSVSYAVYLGENRVASNAKAGVYSIVASFKGNSANYNAIENMTATLTVNKRVIRINDKVQFDDATVNFDRQVHSLAVQGDLPSNVTVSYENNDQIYAGDYEVIAKFSAVSENETVDVEKLSAYLIINTVRESVKINGHEVSADDLTYNKDTYRMVLVGLDTQTYGVGAIDFYDMDAGEGEDRIEWGSSENALIEGKSYRYSIKFYYKDEGVERSVRLSTSSGTYTYHDIALEDTQVVYDGQPHSIQAQYYTRDVEVTYDLYKGEDLVDSAVTVGEYRVVAHFSYLGQEEFFPDKTANLSIIKADYDMSAVVFPDVEKTYDGEEYVVKLAWYSILPSGVTVDFECRLNGVAVSSNAKAGVYQMVAKFTGEDTENYNAIPDMVATLTVNKLAITVTVDGHEIQASDFEYDITQKYIGIFGVDQFKYNIDSLIITYKESQDSEPVIVTFGEEGTGLIDNDNYIYFYTVRFSIVSDSQEVKDSVVINDAKGYFFYNDINKVEEIDLSGVVFADAEVTYNGLAQSLTATNVPENVTVTYEYYQNGEQINQEEVIYAGEYTVVARFRPTTSDKYIKVDFMTAILTVKVFEFTDSDYVFEDEEIVYDGEEHEHKIESLPAYIGVTYKIYSNAEHTKEVSAMLYAGSYYIVAELYAKNESVVISEDYRVKEVTVTILPLTLDFELNGHVVSMNDFVYIPDDTQDKAKLILYGIDLDTYKYKIEVINKLGIMSFRYESSQNTDFYLKMRTNNQFIMLNDGSSYDYKITVEYRNSDMNKNIKFNTASGSFVYNKGNFT